MQDHLEVPHGLGLEESRLRLPPTQLNMSCFAVDFNETRGFISELLGDLHPIHQKRLCAFITQMELCILALGKKHVLPIATLHFRHCQSHSICPFLLRFFLREKQPNNSKQKADFKTLAHGRVQNYKQLTHKREREQFSNVRRKHLRHCDYKASRLAKKFRASISTNEK